MTPWLSHMDKTPRLRRALLDRALRLRSYRQHLLKLLARAEAGRG